jgi:hypothetical protein
MRETIQDNIQTGSRDDDGEETITMIMVMTMTMATTAEIKSPMAARKVGYNSQE